MPEERKRKGKVPYQLQVSVVISDHRVRISGFFDLLYGNIKDPVVHGIIAVDHIDRSLHADDSYPFINKDIERILHDFDMRCTFEIGGQPGCDEDEIVRFDRFVR